MTATLIMTPAERVEDQITKVIANTHEKGVYVSLNKSQQSMEMFLRKKGIETENLFFIDCVTAEETEGIHIAPDNLPFLEKAIEFFMRDIKEKMYIIIDGLSTLLLYNSENAVAKFVKELIQDAAKQHIDLIAVSVITKEEELLNKIFNFFDEVKR